jgi:hypothetical protein
MTNGFPYQYVTDPEQEMIMIQLTVVDPHHFDPDPDPQHCFEATFISFLKDKKP